MKRVTREQFRSTLLGDDSQIEVESLRELLNFVPSPEEVTIQTLFGLI